MNFYLVQGTWHYNELVCSAVVYEESPEEAIRMVQNFRQFQSLSATPDAWNWEVAEFDTVIKGMSAGIYAWIF